MSTSSPDRNPVEALAEEFRERLRRGEEPEIDAYAERHPELADQIRELFPALVLMEQLKPARGDVTGAFTGGFGGGAPLAAGPKLEQLGDYRVLREVGRGGMGIVYEAEQESLGRRVALKVLPAHSLLDPKHQQRFRREAKAAARLHHTNIVPVYGVGEQDGMLYYVMQFIHGRGLDEVLGQLKRWHRAKGPTSHGSMSASFPEPVGARKDVSAVAVARSLMTGPVALEAAALDVTRDVPSSDAAAGKTPVGGRAPLPRTGSDSAIHSAQPGGHSGLSETGRHYWQSVARIGIQVAEALDYASSQGILHRDIKPSNLLLDTQGNVWVTDFGLAKASDDGDNLTHTGDIVGTLRYMAPERFEGRSDVRGDIYSLGLTLYELLVREPAYGETDRNKLIHQVTHQEPPAPRRLNPTVPRDLETIVLKAMARDPARRYQTAAALAEDLQRFVEDKPIRARRVSLSERAWRWCRRNPAVAGLTATIATLLVLAAVASALTAAHFSRLAEHERQARDDADSALVRAELARQDAEVQRSAAEKAHQSEAEQRLQAEAARRDAEKDKQEAERLRLLAEANFLKARTAVDDYLTRVSENDLLNVPGLQPLRRDLLASALTFYQDFLNQRSDDRNVRAALAAAQLSVGRIYRDLGQAPEAAKTLNEALKTYEELATQDPKNLDLQAGLANAYRLTGAYAKSVAAWENVLKVEPRNAHYQSELAQALNSLATQRDQARDYAGALDAHQRALPLRVELARGQPRNPALQVDLSMTLNNLGVLLDRYGQPRDAYTLFARAVEHNEAACAQAPDVTEYGRFLTLGYMNLGLSAQKVGRYPEAVRWMQQGCDLSNKLALANPAVSALQSNLYSNYVKLSRCQRELGHSADAARTLQLATEALERLPRQTPAELYSLACIFAYSSTLVGEGSSDPTAEDLAERRRLANQGLETLRRAIAAGFRNVEVIKASTAFNTLRTRQDFQDVVARLEQDIKNGGTGRPGADVEAEKRQAQQAALLNRSDLAAGHYAIGLLQMDMEKLPVATQTLTTALDEEEALVRDDADRGWQHRIHAAQIRVLLGQLDWRAGRFREAVARWRTALETIDAALRDDPDNVDVKRPCATALLAIGQTYARSCVWQEALPHLRRATELVPDDHLAWYYLAHAAFQAADNDEYHRVCRVMLDRFGDSRSPDASARVGQVWLLSSEPVQEPERLAKLAEQGVKVVLPALRPGRLILKGITAYRTGQLDQAVQWLEEGLQANPPDAQSRARGQLFLALAQHRRGQTDAARQALARGREIVADELRPAATVNLGGDWFNWIAVQACRREAELLLEGSSAPEPMEFLFRARAYGKLGEADKAEAELQTLARLRPGEAATWSERGRLRAELGQDQQAEADLTRAIEIDKNGARWWLARARFHAERGHEEQAGADFAEVARLSPDNLQRFLEAGWWVAGPYPEEFRAPCPPEKQTDPSRPVASSASPPTELPWRPVPTGKHGYVNLGPPFEGGEHLSGYALNYIYSPVEKSATLLVGGDDLVRVWLNGQLVHEVPAYRYEYPFDLERVPVTLHAGRNTVLVKVTNAVNYHYFHLRVADGVLDRAFTQAEIGLWNEAATLAAQGFEQDLPTSLHAWRRCALLLRLTGDDAGYRRLCARVVERFGMSSDIEQAYTVAYVCNLAQDSVKDRAPVLAQASRAQKGAVTRLDYLFEDCVAKYRAGQYDAALKGLDAQAALKEQPKTHALLAMIHQRLGHTGEARMWLEKAAQWYDKALKDTQAAPAFQLAWTGPWWEFGEFQVLYREAHALLRPELAQEDAAFIAFQERARAAWKQRDPRTAAYDDLILRYPLTVRFWVSRARYFAEHQDEARAEADLAHAVTLKTDDPQPWKECGRLHAELGKPDRAAADFLKALALVKDSPTPWWGDRAGIDDELVQWPEVFERVVQERPKDVQLWIARVRYLARREQWPEAAAAVDRVLELDPASHEAWFVAAPLRLQQGDVEGYRRVCQEMIARFGQTNDPILAERTAKSCTLRGDAVSDWGPVVRLADLAVAGNERHDAYRWFLLARGMAAYRAGDHAGALDALRKCLGLRDNPPVLDGLAHLFLALAQHPTQDEEARRALATAGTLMEQKFPHVQHDSMGIEWGDWLRFQIVRREAEEVLKEKTAQVKPGE